MIGFGQLRQTTVAPLVIAPVPPDGKVLFDSGVVDRDHPKPVEVDLTGVRVLDLVVGDAGDAATTTASTGPLRRLLADMS